MDSKHEPHTPVLFLAMFWSGPGAKTISEIIGVYDWINRLIISKTELEDALNSLLSAGLVERLNDDFKISDKAYAEFDAFLRKRKRNKFDAVRAYFQKLDLAVENVTAEVQLSDEQYSDHLSEYRKEFSGALTRTSRDCS